MSNILGGMRNTLQNWQKERKIHIAKNNEIPSIVSLSKEHPSPECIFTGTNTKCENDVSGTIQIHQAH